jgi:hypothetical protein
VFAASPRQVLHRLPRDQADKFFDVDPVFFPTRGWSDAMCFAMCSASMPTPGSTLDVTE